MSGSRSIRSQNVTGETLTNKSSKSNNISAEDGTAADISQEGNGSVSDNITGNIKSNKKLAAGCQENPFSKNIIALPRKCFRVPARQQQVCYDKNSFKQQ